MTDEAPGLAEADVEPAKREASAEETTYAGSLATSETVDRVMEARSDPEPLAIQGVLAELHRQAIGRLRPAKTA
jgi:hypothetical protein